MNAGKAIALALAAIVAVPAFTPSVSFRAPQPESKKLDGDC